MSKRFLSSSIAKKLICVGVLLIMCTALFLTGCKEPDFELDTVSVVVKEEYRQKFLDEEFTADDFNWENVESFRYDPLMCDIQEMIIQVDLRTHGKKQVSNAVKHFNQLEFVEYARLNYLPSIC